MKISSFNYLVNQGFSNIGKNRMMSFASFCITLVSLLMVGLSVLTTININRIINSIEDKNEIVVIVDDNASEIDMATLAQNIKNSENIMEVNFFSKDQAWEEMKSSMTNEEQDLFRFADSNPLPNTYRIRVEDIAEMSSTVSIIENYQFVDSVKSPNDFADIFVNLRTIFAIISTGLVGALVVVCIVIISNTTRSSVFIRRKEINIMKYVGATNRFIRIPFFIEGMSIGVLAAGGALILTKFIYEYIFDIFTSNITLQLLFGMSSIIPFNDILLEVGIIYIATGAFIGAFGSVFSTRKHLKV